jgi:hypothetical protein
MTSFLRISDIPPHELHLLPIIGLRQQIREDRNRPSPPNDRTDPGEAESSSRGQTFHADVLAAEMSAATGETFVTDWQLQDEPRPNSRLPFNGEDSDDDEDRDDEDFGDEDFGDPEDGDVSEREDMPRAGGSRNTGDNFHPLYVDIGGEG